MADENGSRLLCLLFKLSPSTLEQTISVNHPQSLQLISFVCVQKNSPEVDGSNELKSIGCNRKTDPSRYSPTRVLTQHASLVSRAAVQARREMQRSQGLTLRKVGTFQWLRRGEGWGGRGVWPAESLRNGPHWTLHEVWPEAGTKPRSCLADADPPPLRLRMGLEWRPSLQLCLEYFLSNVTVQECTEDFLLWRCSGESTAGTEQPPSRLILLHLTPAEETSLVYFNVPRWKLSDTNGGCVKNGVNLGTVTLL